MYCKNCGLGVIVIEGQVFKPCSCDAPIIAEMQAVTYSHGGLQQN
jgi:hypothetical protein